MHHREIIIKGIDTEGLWVVGNPNYNQVRSRNPKDNTLGIIDKKNRSHMNIREQTICQFTGLQDMENNKIFDNDIIKTGEGTDESPFKSWQVVWSKVIGQYRLKNINGPGELPLFPSNQRGVIINNAHNKES